VLTWADGGALLAVLVWGVSFPVMKALMAVVDPLALVFVLWLVALAVLATVLRLTGQWRLPAREELPALLTVGLVGFTLNQIVYAWGLHLTSASHAGLIFTVTPLVVFGLSWMLGQVRVRGRDVLGLGLGVGGAALIIGWPDDRASGQASVLGNFGAEDQGPTPQQVKTFEAALKKAGKKVNFKIYPGAGHAFANVNNPWGGYREAAAKDAWDRTVKFFDKELKKASIPKKQP
jgi:uncharacterized membrane protein